MRTLAATLAALLLGTVSVAQLTLPGGSIENCTVHGNVTLTGAEECFFGVFAGQDKCCKLAKNKVNGLLDCINCCENQCTNKYDKSLCGDYCDAAAGTFHFTVQYGDDPEAQGARLREINAHILEGGEVDLEMIEELEWFIAFSDETFMKRMAAVAIGSAWDAGQVDESLFARVATIYHILIRNSDVRIRSSVLTLVGVADLPIHAPTAFEDLAALFDDQEQLEADIRAEYEGLPEERVLEYIAFHNNRILDAMERIAGQ